MEASLKLSFQFHLYEIPFRLLQPKFTTKQDLKQLPETTDMDKTVFPAATGIIFAWTLERH